MFEMLCYQHRIANQHSFLPMAVFASHYFNSKAGESVVDIEDFVPGLKEEIRSNFAPDEIPITADAFRARFMAHNATIESQSKR